MTHNLKSPERALYRTFRIKTVICMLSEKFTKI